MIIREMGFHLITLILTVSSVSFVIPNISSNPKDYNKIEKTIKNAWIKKRPFEDKTGKHIEKTFFIQATDNYEVYVSKDNADNWDFLVDTDLRGKSFEVLLRNSRNGNLNPASLKVDGRTVINFDRHLYLNYLILFMSSCCIFYSIILVRKRLKET